MVACDILAKISGYLVHMRLTYIDCDDICHRSKSRQTCADLSGEVGILDLLRLYVACDVSDQHRELDR